MGLLYAGCIDRLYVLGSDRKTYARDMFYARDPHRVAAQFIAEHSGIAAVMTRVGGDAPHTWGVTGTSTWLPLQGGYTSATIYYFPGAQHAVQLVDGTFVPLRKKKDRLGRDRWAYAEWPADLPRPNTIPFADAELWVPNLR